MKCLLVKPRWIDEQSIYPSSGRPHLDLLLHCLGYSEIDVMEVEPEAPFDPVAVDESIGLILVQADGRNPHGRLRRSLLSSLGLSLGLDGEDSDRLRVVGARPLHDPQGEPAGFVINRRGRLVAFSERSIWDLRRELFQVVSAMLAEEDGFRQPRYDTCWLVENRGAEVNLARWMSPEEQEQCLVHHLPDGDIAILLSSMMGVEFKRRLQQRLGQMLYSLSPQPLEEIVGQQLLETGLNVAVAESCTGGLVSARLTAVAGSSAYVRAGFTTYANEAKMALGVNHYSLEVNGAVSQEVAGELARKAQERGEADIGVGVTGIAGPGGGSAEKPVGTVFIQVVQHATPQIESLNQEKGGFHFAGNRDQIRLQTSQAALHLLRRILLHHI